MNTADERKAWREDCQSVVTLAGTIIDVVKKDYLLAQEEDELLREAFASWISCILLE